MSEKLVILFTAFLTDFLLIAALFWLVCWSFEFNFTWKYTLGLWAMSKIIKTAISMDNK